MKETELYTSVTNKLNNKYPSYFENLIREFSADCNIESKKELKQAMKQYFFGWLFLDYKMIDGKQIVDFCISALTLSKEEILILEKINKAKRGIFEITKNSEGTLKLRDILTKEKHNVSVIDFVLNKGIIKANLVYNLSGELFLFGGAKLIDKDTLEQYLIEDRLMLNCLKK